MSTNKKHTTKRQEKKKTKSNIFDVSIGKLFLILSLLVAFASYYVVNLWMTPPILPKLELNEFWGSHGDGDKVDTSIRPFKVEFSDEMLNDLKDRLLHHRAPPNPLDNVGFSYGFNANFLSQVVHYWRNKYNFKEREDYFNKYDNYMTNIQGLDIHYVHVKPEKSGLEVVPILLLHGWPSSIREFYDIIPTLTDTNNNKGIVFEVIVPSLPGFGFSQAPSRPGFGPIEMSILLNNFMARIGLPKYYLHGGGLGHVVGSTMATLFPENVLGYHTNMPVIMFHPIANVLVWLGSVWPNMIETPELQSRMYPLSERLTYYLTESGYVHLQATKPDTIGAALSDTPTGLAAYILEKFSTLTNPKNKMSYDGSLLDYYSFTSMLDNLMIYWASNSVTTSMRVFAEFFNDRHIPVLIDRSPTPVPTCGIKFKHEPFYQPDSILKLKYNNYLQTTIVDDGGHYPALENPKILAEDIFKAVVVIRKFNMSLVQPPPNLPQTVYDFTVKDINGKNVKLESYKGFVLLIVNVASQCGLTDNNYKELNELHEKFYNKGLRILAFPCNQFNSQEPGSAKEILQFTKERRVKFDLFQKVDVNGDKADPLWTFLKKTQSGTLGDFIKWNFSKFIVDRNGRPVERFSPTVSPLELIPYLEKYL